MKTRHGRIVILDRDGVINQDSAHYIKHPGEWQPIPGSLEAIALLHRHGYKIYVATNQAGIARGKLTESSLAAIHSKMISLVTAAGGKLSGIHYCPHHPADSCQCRKPAPGMLLDIGTQSGITLDEVPYVGDSLKDIRAAEAAGCRPVLVLTGNGSETSKLRPSLKYIYNNLLAFAKDEISL
jgi:D-glycero-D-manno-heptose 1,7-bisphosphate phosphatase